MFGGKIKLKFFAVLYNLLSQFNVGSITLLSDLFKQNRAQRGVQLFSNILQQYRSSKLDSIFKSSQEIRVRKLNHKEFPLLFHTFDPLVGLPLWVYTKRPSS